MLHQIAKTPYGNLHIVELYGVAAPTTEAKKAMQQDLAETLDRLLNRLRGQFVIAMGDMNAVANAADRHDGALESYDTSPHALWQVLRRNGYRDVYEHRHATKQRMFTFYRSGAPNSRIDQFWISRELAWHEERMQQPTLLAIASESGPLATDHVAVLLNVPSLTTSAATGSERAAQREVTLYSSTSRSTFKPDKEQAQNYKQMLQITEVEDDPEAENPEEGLGAEYKKASDKLMRQVSPWMATQEALLGLSLERQYDSVELDAAQAACEARYAGAARMYEHAIARGREVHGVFLDMKSAYDSVPYGSSWTLQWHGCTCPKRSSSAHASRSPGNGA